MKAIKSHIKEEFSPFRHAAKQNTMKPVRSKACTAAVRSNYYALTSHKFDNRKESFAIKRHLANPILAAETDQDFWLAFEAEHKKLQSQLSESSYYPDSSLEQSFGSDYTG